MVDSRRDAWDQSQPAPARRRRGGQERLGLRERAHRPGLHRPGGVQARRQRHHRHLGAGAGRRGAGAVRGGHGAGQRLRGSGGERAGAVPAEPLPELRRGRRRAGQGAGGGGHRGGPRPGGGRLRRAHPAGSGGDRDPAGAGAAAPRGGRLRRQVRGARGRLGHGVRVAADHGHHHRSPGPARRLPVPRGRGPRAGGRHGVQRRAGARLQGLPPLLRPRGGSLRRRRGARPHRPPGRRSAGRPGRRRRVRPGGQGGAAAGVRAGGFHREEQSRQRRRADAGEPQRRHPPRGVAALPAGAIRRSGPERGARRGARARREPGPRRLGRAPAAAPGGGPAPLRGAPGSVPAHHRQSRLLAQPSAGDARARGRPPRGRARYRQARRRVDWEPPRSF